MTWTRLDDSWTDDPRLAQVSFDVRWHYLAMIQMCSRTKRYDGKLRLVDALRASDVPDPSRAINALVGLGLATRTDPEVALLEIDDHVPSESVRNNSARTRERMRRSRQHQSGDHSECYTDHCKHAPEANGPAPKRGKAARGDTPSVTAAVTRNPGTGQDGPGRGTPDSSTTSALSTEGAAPQPEPSLASDFPPVGPPRVDRERWNLT